MADWKVSKLSEIKPRKPEWPAGMHSIGYHFGITGFGVSAKTVDKGVMLTPCMTRSKPASKNFL
jgi:hypothetical protein